jgi:uncharacterized lipoprotein YddW (UPF0748 family)
MLALAALLTLANAAPAPAEMRGLWVVRTGLVSPAAVDRVVDEAARAGFNALFAQVRGRCDAFYRSLLVPMSPLVTPAGGAFDPLARLVQRARPRGLQVHAWINVMLCAPADGALPPGHLLRQHPGYAMVARSADRGKAEGRYLSPSSVGVVRHLEAVVRELVRGYALDGLHLDYIRYPGPEYDYSLAALTAFERYQEFSGARPAPPDRVPGVWAQYRRDALTALTGRLARAAREERPGLRLSAAVVPDDTQALHQKFQDWPSWLEHGVLDAVAPMAYAADPLVFRRQLDATVARAPRGQVWAGIGAYRLSTPAVLGRVREARAAGARGVVVFSHEWLQPADAAELRAGAFPPQLPPAIRPSAGAIRAGAPPR